MTDTSAPHFGDLPLRFVARIVLEFMTPFVVSSGLPSQQSTANDVVRDANGLPTIPGSSLCGVLRHGLYDTLVHGGASADEAGRVVGDLFGPSTEVDGTASRLSVTTAHIHDSKDRPVDGLLSPTDSRLQDPVIANARAGIVRSRVRISHRGASDGRGKFEDFIIPAGHRFTVDLTLRGHDQDDAPWDLLLDLLHTQDLRLGGGTRHGHGAVAIARCASGVFDLRKRSEFMAYCALPASLDERADLAHRPAPDMPLSRATTIVLKGLRMTTPWGFGGGVPIGNEGFAPVTEHRIVWHDGTGVVAEQPTHVIPATGIKGVLAHRVAWHFNRLTGVRADALSADDLEAHTGDRNEAVRWLFGTVSSAYTDAGRRGCLILDDVFLTTPARHDFLQHVSLDRFTGGARSGLLFSEQVLKPKDWRCDYRIVLVPLINDAQPADEITQALRATLEDVRRGRLAVGGGTGRGNGRLTCDAVIWPDHRGTGTRTAA